MIRVCAVSNAFAKPFISWSGGKGAQEGLEVTRIVRLMMVEVSRQLLPARAGAFLLSADALTNCCLMEEGSLQEASCLIR